MDPTKIEYRVRPITRYVVTRYHENGPTAQACTTKGEFDNSHIAYEVAYALARDDHERLGWLPGDERISYPEPDTSEVPLLTPR